VDLLIRLVVGGAIVTLFSVMGDVLRPKSFAGLFGAAPSVAMAGLGMTMASDGIQYASIEARSMALGAVALLVYAASCARLLGRGRMQAAGATLLLLPVWAVVALGLWASLLR
jgi:uncharacterized membrane protein (GlpM family)